MGFISDLLGGGQGDPGPSDLYRQSSANAREQRDTLYDAFWGSNRRKAYGSAYGSRGIGANETTKAGWGDTYGRFNYAPQTGGIGSGGALAAAGGYGGGVGNSELWGGNTPFGNLPILQQIMQASGQGITANNQTLADYDRGQEKAYREAQRYGTGQGAVIDEDSRKALADQNALSIARMNASGLGGSTLTTDALSANSANNLREKLRAKNDLADRATGMKTGLRAQSAQGRAGLQTGLNATNQALRMAPINAQLSVLQSPVANPFSPTGGSAPQDTSAIGGLGSVLGTLGGFALGGPIGAGIANTLFGGSSGFMPTASGLNSPYNPASSGYYGQPAGAFGF